MSGQADQDMPRCDVRLVTRPVGRGQAFMIRALYINGREYLVPANAEVLIHAVPHGISTLTVTLFPTSIAFEREAQHQPPPPDDDAVPVSPSYPASGPDGS